MAEIRSAETGEARPRYLGPVLHLGAGLMVVLPILWVLQVPPLLGLALYPEQLLAAVLGLSLGLVFLRVRARKASSEPPPWHDVAAAVLGVVTMAHVAISYERLLIDVSTRTPETLAIGVVVVVLVMEGLRRTAGTTLFLVVLAFILYALVADLVPGALEGRPIGLEQLFNYLALDTNSVLGLPMKVGSTIVLMFILMGQLLFAAGGGEFFTDFAMASMGRRRGGAAKIAVVASALFGSISGTAVSNVASTGVITIPMMRRSGYSAMHAGAIEAVASTGGQLMPPIMGASAFLIAEFLEIDYTEVIIAAALPAVLYYVAVFIQVDLVAAREKIAVAGPEAVPMRRVVTRGWHFIVAFAVLLYALFELMVEPEVAALYAAAAVVVLGLPFDYRGTRLKPRDVLPCLSRSGLVMLELFMILAGAGFVIGVLNITGLGPALAGAIVDMSGSNLAVLLIIAAVTCIILGMGMPTVGVYILLATMVAPAVIQAGVAELSAHMFILYFGMMSMITPPIAMAAYAAAAISTAPPMRTGWESMRLGWVAYIIPFLFVLSPPLLMEGTPVQILIAVAQSGVGVYFVSVAVVGYFARPLAPAPRGLLGLAGLATLIPYAAFDFALIANAAGLAAAAALVGREHVLARNGRARAAGASARPG